MELITKLAKQVEFPGNLLIWIIIVSFGFGGWITHNTFIQLAQGHAIGRLEDKQIIQYRICRDIQDIKTALKLPVENQRRDPCDPEGYR